MFAVFADANRKGGHVSKEFPSSPERRSFFTRFNARATSLAALAIGGVAMAKPKSAARWEPARHDKDDWLDQPPVKHRLLFDTITSDGLGEALAFGGNFIRVNKSEYGLESKDLAVVIVLRHHSTPFGYNDAIWAKYGAVLAPITPVEDPNSKLAPKVNIYNSEDYANLLPSRGTTLDSLTKQGVLVAVCSVATRGIADVIAGKVGGNSDAINKELIASLVPNARMVPAGIVAVNRAQERGYTLAIS
jgi:intracellular sulfur oxidation DsrE/DsrF family protein